ncbi:Solute carrier family 25 member 43 [Holothuria leucospilota]|uniref:Solute carrier family 25 member 43 n=1 Tax=Holothuria leucospilota TaxID=206669 RepID=A0A9Q1GZL4_HOLLE|nr:Solute carrier family 25 member 43 [Holothuria leucospilota]
MAATRRDNRLTFLQNFTCTAAAGIAARTVISPLDVTKVLMQVGTKDTHEGLLKTFTNVYKSQGIRAFWKGNFMGCLRLVPFSAIQFSAFNQLKRNVVDDNGRMNSIHAMMVGCMAGMVATVVTYPTDMVKTRLIVQSKQRRRYRGIAHAFALIMKEEGLLAFYRGMLVSLLGSMPFAAITFSSYETLDQIWGKPRYMYTPMQSLLNGCISAAVAQSLCFPFDTIRKKLQAQSPVIRDGGGVDVQFKGAIGAVRATFRRYGFAGFWRGNAANLCKIVPYSGIMFMTFEALKRSMLYENGYTVSMFDDTPKQGIDQTMQPSELVAWRKRHS